MSSGRRERVSTRPPIPRQGYLLPVVTTMLILLFFACGGRPYHYKHIAKSDTDLVADAHLLEMARLMKTLMPKLYKRNPVHLSRSPGQTVTLRMDQVFQSESPLKFEELEGKTGIDALELCFDDRFEGDRVLALMAGLVEMIRESYNYQEEFFIIDSLDQQKLYNSARNLEILVWRLSNRRDREGKLYLLTNGREGDVENLSFERLFGKMIAVQDMMARIQEDRTNRAINMVVRSAASAAFMPLGL